MKNTFAWIAVIVAAALMLFFPAAPAFSGFAQGLVGLPEEGLQLVLFLITAAVAWLLLKLGTVLGIDLSGYVQPVVAILAPIVITFIEKYLGMIPPIYDNVVLTIIHLIVLLVGGSVGAFLLVKRSKESPRQLLA